jgi:hypothetical protein
MLYHMLITNLGNIWTVVAIVVCLPIICRFSTFDVEKRKLESKMVLLLVIVSCWSGYCSCHHLSFIEIIDYICFHYHNKCLMKLKNMGIKSRGTIW